MIHSIAQYFSKQPKVDIQIIPLEALVNESYLDYQHTEVHLLREDRMFPELEGNKFRKLKYHLLSLDSQSTILSVAGPYSNHLHALATATKLFGLKAKVLIRKGRVLNTPTTEFALKSGVELIYVEPSAYRLRHDIEMQQSWLNEHRADYFIPEGGGGEKGIKACTEILANEPIKEQQYTHICCAAGSGTMIAGIAQHLAMAKSKTSTKLIGISAVKQTQHLEQILNIYAPEMMRQKRIQLIGDTTFKGFGKWDQRLLKLMEDFDALDMPLEHIYTAKMLWYLRDFIITSGTPNELNPMKILCIHSGGLQGRCGLISAINAF